MSGLPSDPLADEAVVRASFESAPDGLLVLSSDDRILAFNAHYLALWNFPPDLLARRNAAEMRRHSASLLQDPQAYLSSIELLSAARHAQVFDTLALLDGRVFERHISPLGVLPGRPGVTGVVIRWRDITARHRAEQALAQSRSRLAAIFEHALNAILLANDDGCYVDANPAACRMLGYSRAQLLGLSVAQLVVPGAQDAASAWAGFLAAGQARGRITLRRQDGSQLVAEFSAVAHMVPGVHLSMLSDVTEAVLAQQRQQELTALLDLAMEGADLAFWDMDVGKGHISSVNSHWTTMLGYADDEIGNRQTAWTALVHPDDAPGRQAAWLAHLRGQTAIYQAEFRIQHKAGHWVWLQARGRVVARDAQGRATRVVGTRMDISARKQAEQRLEALAHTDALTGIHNRRRFTELAAAELARAARHGQPLALLMIDLDHFKQINDRLGHAGGDEVLRAFVQTALGVIRQGDVFARVGGEEFAALLPQTELEGALALAQRLRLQTRASPAWLGELPVAYTVSIGVAALQAGQAQGQSLASGASVDALMRAADRALYRCKATGRDQVLAADEPD